MSRSNIGIVFYTDGSRWKWECQECCLDDEAIEYVVCTRSSTGGTDVYIIGDVELNGRCVSRFNSK